MDFVAEGFDPPKHSTCDFFGTAMLWDIYLSP